MVDGTLEVDGAIVAEKIDAGIITAAQLKFGPGSFVAYVGSDGNRKLSLVLADQDFIGEGTKAVPALQDGELHLEVHSPTGKIYARQNVVKGTEDGQTNVWVPLY